jgi:hypothetical protein
MAAYRLSGPLCCTTYPPLDEGTSCLSCSPLPGPVCVSLGTPMHKSSHGIGGLGGARQLMIHRSVKQAVDMLTKRLDDLDKWEVEMKGLARKSPALGIDELMKPLSAAGEVTRKLFYGWFGTVSASARAKVRIRIVKAIQKLQSVKDDDFLTERKDTGYAYVNPGIVDHGKYEETIHLGQLFWGTDDKTRAGTLIHEVSHFVTVGDTDDVGVERNRAATDFPGKVVDPHDKTSYGAYGGTRATRLAAANPALALKNADNFEFFIEGDEPSLVRDEHGQGDSEGLGDFPSLWDSAG